MIHVFKMIAFESWTMKFVILPLVISSEFAWDEKERCLVMNHFELAPYFAEHLLDINVWSLLKPFLSSF